MRNLLRGAIAALALGATGLAAQGTAIAADLPSYKAPPPAFIEPPFHPFQVRLKVGGVIPLDGTATIYDNGGILPNGVPVLGLAGLNAGLFQVVPGASTSISWSVIPMLDVAYYFNRNWAIEAICCVSPHHIQGTGVLAGASLGRTWVFPPSLLLQYHFTNFGAFQPYLGVGVNFTTFWGTRAGNNNWALNAAPGSALAGVPINASFYSLSVKPSWGVVGQAGFDYMFNDQWGVNLDVKYIMMEPHAYANIVAFAGAPATGVNPIYVPVQAPIRVNPLVVSAGLTYRFGAGWNVPKLLPW